VDEKRRYHARLAGVLETLPTADPEALCMHFHAAGGEEKASQYGVVAADRAAEAMAFHRAVELYEFVLGLKRWHSTQESELREKLGDAQSNAGHGAQAARHYLAAAENRSGSQAIDLRRRASDQLLRAGYVEEGTEVLRATLGAVGIRLPKTSRGALMMTLLDLLRLRLRGIRYHERAESEISAEHLLRVDTYWSAGNALSMIDTRRGFALSMRHVIVALQTGEPHRVARGLLYWANRTAFSGGPGVERAMRALRPVEELARELNYRYVTGYVTVLKGWIECFKGQWRTSIQLCDEAEAILREDCTGAYWEIACAALATIPALFFLGQFNELDCRVSRMINEANEREDRFAAAVPQTYFGNMVWLRSDQVDEARRRAREVLAKWPHKPFLMQHMLALIGSTQIDLYAGEGPRAWDRINRAWPGFRRSFHAGHQFMRVLAHHLRARAALASLHAGLSDRKLIRSAQRDARRIERERMPWSDPLARLIRASIAASRGRDEEAVEHLELAIRQFEAAEMALYSAAAKTRFGQLLGGDRGQDLISAGTDFMTGQAVRSPERMTQMLAPGFH
jgi:tetratricopeptide (TPR) repeat protein